jgi:UDP-glucuronate 4-epimerase
MALFKFTKSILEGKSIPVFNYGKHRRDFTYIDDIVEGVIRVIHKPAKSNPEWNGERPASSSSSAPWKVYNIGNNQPIELKTYIEALENALGIEAKKEMLPMQPGDIPDTYAEIDDFVNEFDYKPSVSINEGVSEFVRWYRSYFKV